MEWRKLVAELRGAEYHSGVVTPETKPNQIDFGPGLTDDEVASTERRYGFRFPPDLRAFLQTALPISKGFPDWRSGEEKELRSWLDSPKEGILFDIEHNGFWLADWGTRPQSLTEVKRLANKLVDAAPKLIPVFSHRMMASEPHLPGNPVFSVHQTDIIYYGFDLADYLRHEFNLPGRQHWPEEIRQIRFWDIEQFQDSAWSRGSRAFDNRNGQLPK